MVDPGRHLHLCDGAAKTGESKDDRGGEQLDPHSNTFAPIEAVGCTGLGDAEPCTRQIVQIRPSLATTELAFIRSQWPSTLPRRPWSVGLITEVSFGARADEKPDRLPCVG